MGERLLCKQEVVGSIPSASMVCLAWFVWHGWLSSQRGFGFGLRGLASLPLGGAWRAWSGALCSLSIVNQVLVHLWMRRTSRVVSAARPMWWCGSGLMRGVRDGLAWVV